jgi:lipoprotein signal peptidase
VPLLLLTFCVVVAADRASKHLVVTSGRFHVINSRRGWASRTALAIRLAAWLVATAAACALAVHSGDAAVHAGAGAVLGGMAGNLLDGIRGRGVIDFIDLRVWPVFNLADAAIVGGTLLAAGHLIAG